MLLDNGFVSQVGFNPSLVMDATSFAAPLGGLSGLTLNGQSVGTGTDGLFAGGTLGANFEIRDEIGVARQADLDGLARDLIERLEGADPTIGAGDAGLFVDGPNPAVAFVAANETGLAARIELNDAVMPGGGTAWRLRDGLYAGAAGPVGDARLLQDIKAALDQATPPASAVLNPADRAFGDRLSEFVSDVANARIRADGERSFGSAENTALRELELGQGVDTDQELQALMRIEQQYAANAQVMSTVDDLLERLMAI